MTWTNPASSEPPARTVTTSLQSWKMTSSANSLDIPTTTRPARRGRCCAAPLRPIRTGPWRRTWRRRSRPPCCRASPPRPRRVAPSNRPGPAGPALRRSPDPGSPERTRPSPSLIEGCRGSSSTGRRPVPDQGTRRPAVVVTASRLGTVGRPSRAAATRPTPDARRERTTRAWTISIEAETYRFGDESEVLTAPVGAGDDHTDQRDRDRQIGHDLAGVVDCERLPHRLNSLLSCPARPVRRAVTTNSTPPACDTSDSPPTITDNQGRKFYVVGSQRIAAPGPPQSEVGRRRGARGSGPFPSALFPNRACGFPRTLLSSDQCRWYLVGRPAWMSSWQGRQMTRVFRRRLAMRCIHAGFSGRPGLLRSASLRMW